jgi:cyanoexosortase B-associated protein
MTPFRINAANRASNRLGLLKILVVLFVLAVALTSAVPGYLGGKWTWQQTPSLGNLSSFRAILKDGLAVPGWQTLEQQTVEIGGHKWSAQAILPVTEPEPSPQNTVWLLLRPQTWERDLPQIDWTDINGVQQWTTDSQRQIQFTVQPTHQLQKQSTVTARFLRGWTAQRTSAVLQWYAWADGGHPAPSHWFWLDQWRQLRNRQRLAWVAVSIQIPIKPFGEIETIQTEAETLGQLVQTALIEQVFR